jgi:glutamyl-Q tRNA(Asp) synthetase
MATPLVTRFAPSPTGALHLGHAFAAFVVWDTARAAGGQVVVRMEDIDASRCRPEHEAAILDDLTWLGLDWPEPVRRQSEHLCAYAGALDTLIARGLVYRCFRTRRDLMEAVASAPHAPVPAFRGTPLSPDEEAERVARGEAYAWRLSLDRARDHLGPEWSRLAFVADGVDVVADPARHGDVVLARKDAPTSYHLASVHDDALQGVTHVIRGEDLREAAHVHVLLQALFRWPTPVYRHHRLITDPTGRRLAKRDQDLTLAALRAHGETPATLRARLGL